MGNYSTTPQAADGFSRYMAEAFDEKEIISVPTGGQRFFGRKEARGETLFSPDAVAIDIDVIRGNEKTAALIPRGTVSRPLGSLQRDLAAEKFTATTRKFPLAEEEGNISSDQLLMRVAGEAPYERRVRLDRLRYLALKIHHESIRRAVRLFERLAFQSLLEGKMDVILNTTNTDYQFDFMRNPSNFVHVGTAWDDNGPDILGDIDAACLQVRVNGRMHPDFMGIGSKAFQAMVQDSTFQEYVNKLHYNFVRFGTGMATEVPPLYKTLVESGWICKGMLHTPAGYELWVFTYEDIYNEEDGTPVKFMPIDKCFITSVRARFDRYFGPPEMLPMIPQRAQLYQELFGFNLELPLMPPNIEGMADTVSAAMFYTDAYVSPNWKNVTIRTQSSPIFVPVQTDVIATLDGLLK